MFPLVIMAAGMSSRYQKSKQLECLIDNYNLVDFSIYDALKVGFKKIILIVREEQKITFTQKYQILIKKQLLNLCIQKLENIPSNISLAIQRKKPWGTAHCVYSLKDIVKTSFAIINCDDFYGRDSFVAMFQALQKNTQEQNGQENQFFTVGFELQKTLSKQGTVSRGIAFYEKEKLTKIEEHHQIEKKLSGEIKNNHRTFEPTSTVSMNFWGFTPFIFQILESSFYRFLEKENLDDSQEFYLPQAIQEYCKKKIVEVNILKTKAEWFGLTYLADKEYVVQKLQQLIDKKIYPKNLFS